MFTARQIIQDAFASGPKLATKPPEEVVAAISGHIRVQIKDVYNGGELSAPVTIDFINSNLHGYYYCVICDNCRARCRKAYVKKVCTDSIPMAKVLCGKCARIIYKRKTKEEKLAMQYALRPELAEQVLTRGSLKQNMIALESFYFRRELEDRGVKLADKLIGSHQAEIIE